MGLLSKSKESTDEVIHETIDKVDVIQQLLANDEDILQVISELLQKVDLMDKSNKKFLMAATMNDGKTEQLQNQVYQLKMGMIEMIDQIDYMMAAQNESINKGLEAFYKKISEIRLSLGIEEIEVICRQTYNPNEQECVEVVSQEDMEDGVIVGLIQKGYRDLSTKRTLRYAKVTVNQLTKGQEE